MLCVYLIQHVISRFACFLRMISKADKSFRQNKLRVEYMFHQLKLMNVSKRNLSSRQQIALN